MLPKLRHCLLWGMFSLSLTFGFTEVIAQPAKSPVSKPSIPMAPKSSKPAASKSSKPVAPKSSKPKASKQDSSLTTQWVNAPKANLQSWNREKLGEAITWQIYWMERNKVLKLLGQPTLAEDNSTPSEDSGKVDYYQLSAKDNKRLKVHYTDENRVITSEVEELSCQPRVYLGAAKEDEPLLSQEKLSTFFAAKPQTWSMRRAKTHAILGQPTTSYKYNTRENGASSYWLEDVYLLSKDGRKVFITTYYDNPGQSENPFDSYKLETIAQDYQPRQSTKAKRLAHVAMLANVFSLKEWLDAVKSSGDWSRQKQVEMLLVNCEFKGMSRTKVIEMLGEPQLSRIITPSDKGRTRVDSYQVSAKNNRSLSVSYDYNDKVTNSYLSDRPCVFDPTLTPGQLKGGRTSRDELKSKLMDKYTKDQLALKTQAEIRAIIGDPAASLTYKIDRPHSSPQFIDDIYVVSDDGRRVFIISYGQQRKTAIDSQIVIIAPDCPKAPSDSGAMSIFF